MASDNHFKNSISILIPSYNNVCTELVNDLRQQAVRIRRKNPEFEFEIIVADDGSTRKETVEKNRAIGALDDCTFIECPQNRGRAVIRNFLARQAHNDYLLFLDCDLRVGDANFLNYYLHTGDSPVVCGGITIQTGGVPPKDNLRYNYEKAYESAIAADASRLYSSKEFRSTNFVIRRDIMLSYPFDERFYEYGYEDVLFGKRLNEAGIKVLHINNAMAMTDLENNLLFVEKTEESLRTLYNFRSDLKGYSHILNIVERLKTFHLLSLARLLFRLLGKRMRANLTGSHPWLPLFNWYKLGYYINHAHERSQQPARQGNER